MQFRGWAIFLFTLCYSMAQYTVVLGMGSPPGACTNLKLATLLKTRLVNVTAPNGTISSFDLTSATPQPIPILVFSKYTIELTLQTPSATGAQIWTNSNYFGYALGQCWNIPTTPDTGVDPTLPTRAGYINWRLPLQVQLTNISPAGGNRTVSIYGADATFTTGFSLSFNVAYLPKA